MNGEPGEHPGVNPGVNRYARDPFSFHGRVEMRPFASEALAENALGDPHVREVPVYLPPDAGAGGERLPVVFLLSGFTGRGHALLETHPWKTCVVRDYDRGVERGDLPRAILVLPDCFTRLGGSQYVNSSAVGRYEDYVARELTAWVDATYPTEPGRRAVVGKSSGGFGAMHLAMRHPDTFPVAASISGDCHFEYCYGTEFLAALRGLRNHDFDPAKFLAAFAESHDLGGDGHAVLNLLAMSACYSPNPDSPLGFDLPIDLETGERVSAVWERWLEFDPVVACERYAAELSRLELLYLEAGLADEFHLQFALRILARRLTELGIPHEHVEHERGHFDISDRYLTVLPKLVSALDR